MRHGRVMTNNGQLYYPYLKLEDLKLIERKAMNCTKKIINDVRTEMLDSILFRAHKWCDFNHTLSVSVFVQPNTKKTFPSLCHFFL